MLVIVLLLSFDRCAAVWRPGSAQGQKQKRLGDPSGPEPFAFQRCGKPHAQNRGFGTEITAHRGMLAELAVRLTHAGAPTSTRAAYRMEAVRPPVKEGRTPIDWTRINGLA